MWPPRSSPSASLLGATASPAVRAEVAPASSGRGMLGSLVTTGLRGAAATEFVGLDHMAWPPSGLAIGAPHPRRPAEALCAAGGADGARP